LIKFKKEEVKMRTRKILAGALIVVAGVFLLSMSCAIAQGVCEGNFDCDQDVDGTDAAIFKSDYGRSAFDRPCPACDITLPVTGQTTSYATGDDGDLEKGVPWPNPRFTDNENGTVTDNITGLIWLKDADCWGTRSWSDAVTLCSELGSGTAACGLWDNSNPGDWRLPNYRELFSLLDAENNYPALPDGHPFGDVQTLSYWSSTTYSNSPGNAWIVDMGDGGIASMNKTNFLNYVWPVKGGIN